MRRFDRSDRQHVFWWSPPSRRLRIWRRENAGDYLSPVLVERMLRGYRLRLRDKRPGTGRLFAIGSVLHFASDGDVVWGSGVNGKIEADRHRFRNLDVRAVRGPLTREFLARRGIECPPVYGDPALLLPVLCPDLASACRGKQDYVIVPHMHDLAGLRAAGVERDRVISPLVHWRRFVTRILDSRLVLSASLHGLIIAEAFGIPARLLRLSERESLFKYEDYYRGSGRDTFMPATTVAEGLSRGGEPPLDFDPEPLRRAFPLDLWTEKEVVNHA
ncbi:polysaccharide pyruvyl transferase family protein [Arhodomonas sp. AD133]|uniref:polysaccharide pyruvyl transferase family protein n=1 Tax=Arhodomonas sp. AD133 TaxID=3415009 RepID=UPI003EBF3EBF